MGARFKEGLTAGHLLHGKTEERLKEVQAEAYEEGYQAGYEEGQRNEHGDWALEGHGIHCGYRTGIPYNDYGTPATATMSVSAQTDPQDTRYIPKDPTDPIFSHVETQTNIVATENASITTTFDISTQTESTVTVSSQTQTTFPLTTSFTTVSIQTSHEDIEKTDHNPTPPSRAMTSFKMGTSSDNEFEHWSFRTP